MVIDFKNTFHIKSVAKLLLPKLSFYLIFFSNITFSQTIAIQDFEVNPAIPTWSICAGATFTSAATGAGDTPANQRIRSGARSWQVNNSNRTLDLCDISVTGCTSVQVVIYISSTSANATNGSDASDQLRVYTNISGGGFPGTPDITVSGNGNARWGYNTTGTVTTAGTPISVAGSPGTNLGTIYSKLTVDIPAAASSVGLRIIANNNDGNEIWSVDDIQITGSCGVANTITTGSVNNPPFALTDCTVTTAGNVAFTSVGTYSAGNNYTAQLSDASGSFTSAISIGSITSTANSGTISFTIPAGTTSGNGYMIRVVSDNPVITGSNSSVFTITTTCTPTITPGGTITACAFSGAMSIFDKCNNGQGCTTGCDLSTYSNLGYTMCDGSTNNSNCFGAANPGGQQLQGIVFNIPSGCTMSVTVEFKTRGGACSNSGMDNGDYLKINGTTYTGTGNANITQSISQTGGSIFIEQSANRSDEILTFTASIVSGNCLQCSLLDVTLLNFNCISESDGYKLVWATANEHQSKNFEIEYSVDGVEFLKIAEMPAKGESNSYLYYENYIQNVFSSPLLYFRLKMNDLNGGYTYSPIIYVQNDFFSSLSVSPNPSVNTDVIVYVGTKLNYLNSTISIYDVNGKLLVDEIIKDSQTKINTHDFAEGIYLLKVSSPYKTQSFKLIIQK
jgi:hypothetical protein